MSSASTRAAATIAALVCTHAAQAQWLAVPVNGAPPARTGFTFTALPSGDVLLFGGDASNASATEWLWNGIAWRQLTTNVPRREGHAMAALPDGKIVLYGGRDGAGQPLTDTWVLDQGVWSTLSPATLPPAANELSMTFDPQTGEALLVGSFGGTLSTSRLRNGNWVAATTTPLAGTLPTAMADTVRGSALLTTNSGGFTRLYSFENSEWVQRWLVNVVNTPVAGAFDPELGYFTLSQQSGAGTQTYLWDGLALTNGGLSTNAFAAGKAVWHPTRQEILSASSVSGSIVVHRWLDTPRPFATPHGAPCQAPGFVLDLAAGDSPEIGATHRLQANNTNANALTFAVFGFSHTVDGGNPLPRAIPFGALGCQQRVQAFTAYLLSAGPVANANFTVPNSNALTGARYDAQFLQLDAVGILDASNGLEVQIARPLVDRTFREDFNNDLLRDPIASGDTWSNGVANAVAIGGDGRHGSFDAAFGVLVGPNHYQWNTDNQVIPGTSTLSGGAELVSDGKFYFTDLVVPAGVTIEFTGSAPAQLHVRGRADVQGTLLCNAAPMPFWIPTSGPAAGQRLSNFNGRGSTVSPAPFVTGQPGGNAGPGGGRGGNGGNECQGTGPILVGGVFVTNGQPGQDVRVSAGHAFAAQTVGTGGAGSGMHPATGIAAPNTPVLGSVYRAHFAPGGSGGGFRLAGGQATVTPLGALSVGPTAAAGSSFSLFPLPTTPGYSSLDHFLVGGSGGGGGATHAFGTIYVVGDVYIAGTGGSGGGGALALRAGGNLTVGNSARLEAKGGDGVLINGDDPNSPTADQNWGISSPGGGGSGGSFLLQSGANLVCNGAIDTSGGPGSRTGSISNPSFNVISQAGAGSNGFYRLEATGNVTFAGTGVPTFNATTQRATLTDREARTGSRSLWTWVPSNGLPVYVRYELVADVNGQTLLFSDDAAVSTLRADASAPVHLRLQGARIDPVTGQVDPTTIGPWRSSAVPGGADSVNRDLATAVRFDLVLDKSFGPVRVLELRVLWR